MPPSKVLHYPGCASSFKELEALTCSSLADVSTQSVDANGQDPVAAQPSRHQHDQHSQTEPQKPLMGREKALSEPMCRWLDEPARHGPYNNLAQAEWSNRSVEALEALRAPNGIPTPDDGKRDNKRH